MALHLYRRAQAKRRAKTLHETLHGSWLSDGVLLLVGSFGSMSDNGQEVSVVVGKRTLPLDARSLLLDRPGQAKEAGPVTVMIGRLPPGESIDGGRAAISIGLGETRTSLGSAELFTAVTGLRALLRDHIAGLQPEIRGELLEFILSAATPGFEQPGSFSLSKNLYLVREALREHLPYRVVSKDEPQGLNVDLMMAVDERSFWVEGWVRDRDAASTQLVAVSPEGYRADLLERAFRHERRDVEELYGPPDIGERHGFVKYLDLPLPSQLETGWILQLRDAAGRGVEAEAPAVIWDFTAVRNRILWRFTEEQTQRDQLALTHVYPALTRLQQRLRKTVQVESILRFGTPSSSPNVSIIVPLHQRIDLLQHQLAQFAHDSEIARADLIYVLDSPELGRDLADLAAGLHDLYRIPFRVIRLNRNAGFANANNAAVSVARGRTLLLLNSDVLPDRPGWLGRMAAFYDATPDIGALGPKLLYEDDSLQHAGMYFRRETESLLWGNQHYFKGFHRDFAPANVSRPVPAVTGACMMIDHALYEELGGLRDIYVQGGYEDSDLCLRLIQAGRQNWYVPEVELYHLEDQSYPSSDRQLVTRYNMWVQTHLWDQHIEALTQ